MLLHAYFFVKTISDLLIEGVYTYLSVIRSSLKKLDMKFFISTLLGWALLGSIHAQIYVNANSTANAAAGTTWSDAYPDLQQALSIAEEGDSIFVATGEYKPHVTDRMISFTLPSGVALLGGYIGTEEAARLRDPASYPTILSGDIGVLNDSTDNSYHVVYAIGTDSTTLLDGFIITGGHAVVESNGYFGPLDFGGGILLEGNDIHPVSYLKIRNCIVKDNTADYGGGIAGYGEEAYWPLFDVADSQILHNHARFQCGGLYVEGAVLGNRSQMIHNTNFIENWDQVKAGALYFHEYCGPVEITACEFIRNHSSPFGAGAIHFYNSCDEGTHFRIDDCLFEDNRGGEGKSVRFWFYSGLVDSSKLYQLSFRNNQIMEPIGEASAIVLFGLDLSVNLDIANVSFINSEDDNTSVGSVMTLDCTNCQLELDVRRSIFGKNKFMWFSPLFYFYPGVGFDGTSDWTVNFENCLFYENSGIMFLSEDQVGLGEYNFRNCTFSDNGDQAFRRAERLEDLMAIIDSPNIRLQNCIIKEEGSSLQTFFINTDADDMQDVIGYQIDNSLFSFDGCPAGSDLSICGEGLIFNTDPEFVNPFQGDFRVAACSPAINAGNNSLIDSLADHFHDLGGNDRIQEGLIDLGAYERPSFQLEIPSMKEVNCFGGSDGFVEMASNGEFPTQYYWIKEEEMGIDWYGLSAGSYTFYAEDALACRDSIQIEIASPALIEAEYEVIPASSAEATDGGIRLRTISGGVTPYRYRWSTVDPTPSIENLSVGKYDLTIVDGNNCEIELSFEVDILSQTNQPDQRFVAKIFPNPVPPSKGIYLSLSTETSTEVLYSITDAYGRFVQAPKSLSVTTSPIVLDLPSQLQAGIYWLKILDPLSLSWQLEKIVLLK